MFGTGSDFYWLIPVRSAYRTGAEQRYTGNGDFQKGFLCNSLDVETWNGNRGSGYFGNCVCGDYDAVKL